jgi:hypothetical protein
MLDSACVRIGELETVKPGGAGGGANVRPPGQSKTEALEDAGIPRTTANDYEHLAGGREQQAQDAARAGAESYFAASREAVVAILGPRD